MEIKHYKQCLSEETKNSVFNLITLANLMGYRVEEKDFSLIFTRDKERLIIRFNVTNGYALLFDDMCYAEVEISFKEFGLINDKKFYIKVADYLK